MSGHVWANASSRMEASSAADSRQIRGGGGVCAARTSAVGRAGDGAK